jgi:LmbE family N-acetylglucosaminyl deacetylase
VVFALRSRVGFSSPDLFPFSTDYTNLMNPAARTTLYLTAALATLTSPAMASQSMSASAIVQELNNFRQTGTVLYIAAHPDDEGTDLIASLARGRGYRTGYLSLTRGDGGQNLIGPELRDELGVIRTQELLAARGVDGGEQFFSRAVDFGFSKSVDETLAIWNRDEVLGDVVRVIRTFKPDVIVTRFSPVPSGTHGHHTASAQLAVEAFELAGDPKAYPEQLETLQTWQPKRVFWNSYYWGREPPADADIMKVTVGGYNPLFGLSYGEISASSRSMHKSQGFGRVGSLAESGENLELIAGPAPHGDFMDGVDASWNRIPGGAEVGALADKVLAKFNPQNPAGSIPALLALRGKLSAIKGDGFLSYKRGQLDEIIIACLGMRVESLISDAVVTTGGTVNMTHQVIVRNDFPVSWVSTRYPTIGEKLDISAEIEPGAEISRESARELPAGIPLTHPYWLREPGTVGMFRVDGELGVREVGGDGLAVGIYGNGPAVVGDFSHLVANRINGSKDKAFPAGSKGQSQVGLDFDGNDQVALTLAGRDTFNPPLLLKAAIPGHKLFGNKAASPVADNIALNLGRRCGRSLVEYLAADGNSVQFKGQGGPTVGPLA